MKIKLVKSVILCFFVLITSRVSALNFNGSESFSLGGSGLGSVSASDSFLQNPASILFYKAKVAGVGASYRTEHVYLVDNGAEALFPAALSYATADFDGLKKQNLHVGSAWKILKHLSCGMAINWNKVKDISAQQNYSMNSVDVGISFVPNERLTFGVVGKDLALNTTALNDYYDHNPELGVGFEYNFGNWIKLKTDLTNKKNTEKNLKGITRVGFEYFSQEWLALRLGYQENQVLENNYTSIGFFMGGAPFGLHYAYIKEAKKLKDEYHSIDLVFPF